LVPPVNRASRGWLTKKGRVFKVTHGLQSEFGAGLAVNQVQIDTFRYDHTESMKWLSNV